MITKRVAFIECLVQALKRKVNDNHYHQGKDLSLEGKGTICHLRGREGCYIGESFTTK